MIYKIRKIVGLKLTERFFLTKIWSMNTDLLQASNKYTIHDHIKISDFFCLWLTCMICWGGMDISVEKIATYDYIHDLLLYHGCMERKNRFLNREIQRGSLKKILIHTNLLWRMLCFLLHIIKRLCNHVVLI